MLNHSRHCLCHSATPVTQPAALRRRLPPPRRQRQAGRAASHRWTAQRSGQGQMRPQRHQPACSAGRVDETQGESQRPCLCAEEAHSKAGKALLLRCCADASRPEGTAGCIKHLLCHARATRSCHITAAHRQRELQVVTLVLPRVRLVHNVHCRRGRRWMYRVASL